MAEQLSQKRGVRSSAQKEERARNQYEETPASSEVRGAHGNVKPQKASDNDVALKMDEKRQRQSRESNQPQ